MTIAINFHLEDKTRKSFRFSGIDELKDFAKKESDYWRVQRDIVAAFPSKYVNESISAGIWWGEVYKTLDNWKDDLEKWDDQTAQNNLNNQFGNWRNQLNGRWVWSGAPFNDAWIGSYRLSKATGDAFFNAITGGDTGNTGQFEYLKGYILAYEFLLQDENTLTRRRNGEEKAFSRLRNQLAEKKDELIGQIVELQEDVAGWKKETQGQYEGWFTNQQEDYRSWKQDQDEAYAAEHEQHKSQFDQQMSEWVGKITDLEHTYHEKLRLEKPVVYWNTRAKKLRNQGLAWTAVLVAILATGASGFGYFFTHWLTGVETVISLHSFQGAVLLTVIISSFVFAIRVTSRLAFSAFHLQRDCEEREQLTHVYLALANEAQPDAESRKIILQSLFSRAETGLLANEAGPTMPGLSEAVSAAARGGARQ